MTGPGWSVAAADCLSPAGEKQPAADLFFGGIWLRTIPGILYYLAGEYPAELVEALLAEVYAGVPLDLPTAAEVDDMARAIGLDEIPF